MLAHWLFCKLNFTVVSLSEDMDISDIDTGLPSSIRKLAPVMRFAATLNG